MPKSLFISLPVKDVAKSKAFYKSVGFAFNPKFTGDQSACLAINETTNVMLLPRSTFQALMPKGKEIADANRALQALIAIGVDSRAEVDELVKKAVAAGGTTGGNPSDEGFMYSDDFTDPDGHGWGPFWMDPNAAPPQS